MSRFRLSLSGLATVGVVAASICVISCASPEAISTFADSAQKALASGSPIFSDIHESCVRRQKARPSTVIRPLFVPPGSKNAPPKDPPALDACARFATEATALSNVSSALIAYFRAMQELAAFNASSVSTGSQAAAVNSATAAGLNPTQVDSAGKLAGLVTRIFTGGYQRSRLREYLGDADAPVANITEGFDTVTKNYVDFLQEEQQTVTARYQSVADTDDKATLLLLNRAYTDDMADIQRRRTVAEAYRDALKAVRDGHHQLLTGAQHLSAKELNVALQPYTSTLGALIPELQKSK